jgi:hypothetical protein
MGSLRLFDKADYRLPATDAGPPAVVRRSIT